MNSLKFILLFSFLLILACNKDNDMKKDNTCPDCPVIDFITPERGQAGTRIEIHGSNFENVSHVLFDGVREVEPNEDSVTNEMIILDAPNISETKTVSVEVFIDFKAPNGTRQELSSREDITFDYDYSIILSDFTPKSAKKDSIVTIYGSNFGSVITSTVVSINDIPANIVSMTNTEINIQVPKGAGNGKIKIKTEESEVWSEEDFSYILSYIVSDFVELSHKPRDIDFYDEKIVIIGQEIYSVIKNGDIVAVKSLPDNNPFLKSKGGGFSSDGTYYYNDYDGFYKMNFSSTNFSTVSLPEKKAYAAQDLIWHENILYYSFYITRTSHGLIRWSSTQGSYLDIDVMEDNGVSGDGKIPRDGYGNFLALDETSNNFSMLISENSKLRRFQDENITTITGHNFETGYVDGKLEDARFDEIQGVIIDSQGDIYIADSKNHCIRKIDINDNLVTTIVGNHTVAGHKNSEGINANFNRPMGLCLDSEGNILVADQNNNKIRKITIE